MNLMEQAVEFVNQVQQIEESEVNIFVDELAKLYQIEIDSEEYIGVKNVIEDIHYVK